MGNIKRFGIVLSAAALAMVGITAGTASASNSSTNGCTQTIVDYVRNADNSFHVNWVMSRNVCGSYTGHFFVDGVNNSDTYPIQAFKVYRNVNVSQNTYYCGTGWRYNSPGNYTMMGNACTGVL